MKNKFPLLFSFTTVTLLYWISVSSAKAAPLVSIGDNTDIFFNGSSSLRWASNIFRDEDNEESDLIWTVSPGLEINVGRGISNADLTVVTRYDLVSYQDNDDLDTELLHIEALGSYETSRLSVDGSASFDESKINTPSSNAESDLVELTTTASDLDVEYRLSPKFSFSAGIQYSETEYENFQEDFSDREKTSLPLSVYYELTPKLDLILGYTYATTDIKSRNPTVTQVITGYEQEADFFSIGLRGNLRTKLTGFFKIGYRTVSAGDTDFVTTPIGGGPAIIDRTIDRDNSGMLGLDASLTWMANDKLLYQLDLSRDYGTGGLGEAIESTSVNLVGNYSFNTHWSAMANLGYTDSESTNISRDNEQINGGLRFTYVLNTYWRFSAGYSYSENESNLDGSDYESNTLDFTVILRY